MKQRMKQSEIDSTMNGIFGLNDTLSDIGGTLSPKRFDGDTQAAMALSRIPIEMDWEMSAIKRELAK